MYFIYLRDVDSWILKDSESRNLWEPLGFSELQESCEVLRNLFLDGNVWNRLKISQNFFELFPSLQNLLHQISMFYGICFVAFTNCSCGGFIFPLFFFRSKYLFKMCQSFHRFHIFNQPVSTQTLKFKKGKNFNRLSLISTF